MKEKIMAKKTENKKLIEKVTADKLIAVYMDYVLVNEKTPRSVYKFAKDNDMTEQEFYKFFGSFDGLRKAIWDKFFENSIQVMEKSKEYAEFSNPSDEQLGTSPTQTRNVANDLKLHAPKPSLPVSSAKARVSTVTRTDSGQAAAYGIGKPSLEGNATP